LGPTTLTITTLRIMTFNIVILRILTFSITFNKRRHSA
jgi:hypothetical protein